MNPIQQLEHTIKTNNPEVAITLTSPTKGGVWFLDIPLKDVTVQWSEETDFGVSNTSAHGYGEAPSIHLFSVHDVLRATGLLTKSQSSKHPRYSEFTFDIKNYPNGFKYATSENLAGFRLWIQPHENMEIAISEALDLFLPFFERAKMGENAFWQSVKTGMYEKVQPGDAMFEMVEDCKAKQIWICDSIDHNQANGCSNPKCFKYKNKNALS